MRLKNLYSDRHYQSWPSWHIIYEWEDEIVQSLKINITNSPYYKSYFKRKLNALCLKATNKPFHALLDKQQYLYFDILCMLHKTFANSINVVPIIIDFWERDISAFKQAYKGCSKILVANYEVYLFLKPELGERVIHYPLSLPTKYFLESETKFNKTIDLLLPGRTNQVLLSFLQKYVKKNPDFEYGFQQNIEGRLNYITNKGRNLGPCHTRPEYFSLLAKAKIAFYSIPGIDGEESRTNGYRPVTPRFLELLSAGCHLIGRYEEGADVEYYRLTEVLPNIRSYADFENLLNTLLETQESPVKKNSEYLLKHYTKCRMNILKDNL